MARRMNSLKSLAMNCGPRSLMTRGRALGNFRCVPLGPPCRWWCRPSHRGSPTKWAPLPCRPSASLAQTLPGATRSIKAHERPWQRLCNMRACWANPSNCWMPHFRRARRQSGARAQCVPVQPPCRVSTGKRTSSPCPPKRLQERNHIPLNLAHCKYGALFSKKNGLTRCIMVVFLPRGGNIVIYGVPGV